MVFIAADDVWLAPVAGGRAWRFTTDEAQAATPRLAPDGMHVAWVSAKDGSPEIYVAGLAGGDSTRLTYWATSWAQVSGWTPAGEVLAVSRANQPFAHYTPARVLTTALSGGPGAERVLPFGPVSDLSLGTSSDATRGDDAATDGRGAGIVGLLTGKFGGLDDDPASWKRYRGGTAGRLWVGPATAIVADAPDAAGRTEGPFRRVLADLPAQFASPMIVGGRLAFVSDHEGTGNVYSCALDGSDLRRHTDHEGWYARQASTDGQRTSTRVVASCGCSMTCRQPGQPGSTSPSARPCAAGHPAWSRPRSTSARCRSTMAGGPARSRFAEPCTG